MCPPHGQQHEALVVHTEARARLYPRALIDAYATLRAVVYDVITSNWQTLQDAIKPP